VASEPAAESPPEAVQREQPAAQAATEEGPPAAEAPAEQADAPQSDGQLEPDGDPAVEPSDGDGAAQPSDSETAEQTTETGAK
jgi:hypothetical protein